MKLSTYLSMLAATLALASMLALAPAAGAATEAPVEPAAEQSTDAATTKDEPSAAERRAAASSSEREKLDQGAFKEEEQQSSGSDEASSSGGSVARALFGLVVVLASIFGIHWLLKRWGQSRMQGVTGRTGVIDVVATTPLAQGRSLHLVRVGDELVLVGATDQSITRIGEVDAATLGAQMGNQGNGEFQAMLTGAMYGSQPGVPAGMGGAGATKDPFMKRFIDNLRMSTAR